MSKVRSALTDLYGRSGLTARSSIPRAIRQYQRAAAAEMRLQLGQRPGGEVGAGVDPEPLHLGRGDRPDAVEALDRQGGDERRAALGR